MRKEDLNETTESAVELIRSELLQVGGKLKQNEYAALELLIFAFLTTYARAS